MKKNKKKERFQQVIKILISIVIFISASPLFDVLDKIFATSCMIGGVMLMQGRAVVSVKISNVFTLASMFFFVVLSGAALDLIYGYEVSNQGAGFFGLLFLGFILSLTLTRSDFFSANEYLVGLSLFIGLPIYLLTLISPSTLQYALSYEYGDFSHKTFFVINFLLVNDVVIDRFVGFGSEPGLTQVFYLLAIFSRLSKNNGRPDIFIFIVLLAIILSKSTFGIFVVLFVLAYSLSFKNLVKFIIVLSPVIYFIVLDEFAYHVSEKLVGSSSFSGRYDRYFDFFNNEVTTVLFGFGNSHYLSQVSYNDLGGWDSFLQTSQRYGLVFVTSLFVFLLVNNRRDQFPVFVIIISAFFTQTIAFLPVIAFFYFKGFSVDSMKSNEVG